MDICMVALECGSARACIDAESASALREMKPDQPVLMQNIGTKIDSPFQMLKTFE